MFKAFPSLFRFILKDVMIKIHLKMFSLESSLNILHNIALYINAAFFKDVY